MLHKTDAKKRNTMPESRALADLSRQELYEIIWSSPAIKVAADFRVSDVAVHKHCIKRNVPRPTRGYWARVALGQKPRRKPLPPTADEAFADLVQRRIRNTLLLPEQGTSLHLLASELFEALNKAKPEHLKQVHLRATNLPEVTITKPLAERVTRAFHVILEQLEPLGILFRKSQGSYNSGYFKRSHDRLYFYIDETLVDKFGSERRVYSWQWKDGGSPTGRLAFYSKTQIYGNKDEKEWVETRNTSLGRVLSQVV
jgi:hypothetical protein